MIEVQNAINMVRNMLSFLFESIQFRVDLTPVSRANSAMVTIRWNRKPAGKSLSTSEYLRMQNVVLELPGQCTRAVSALELRGMIITDLLNCL